MASVALIEDDSFLIDDLKYFIEEKGHSCTVYRYADDVMASIDNLGKFSTIVLDLMMMKGEIIKEVPPEAETGEIIYKEIRKKYPNMKIIIISAKNSKDLSIDTKADKNLAYYLKPLDEGEIRSMILSIV